MKINVGSLDRTLRTLIGLGLIALALTGTIVGTWKWVALGLGAVMSIVGLSGRCPVYSIFGISTCSLASSKK